MRLPYLVAILLLIWACSVDEDKRIRVCEAFLPVFLDEGQSARITASHAAEDDPRTVIVEYRVADAPPGGAPASLSCTFAGDGRARRLGLIGVSAPSGPLSSIRLELLRRQIGRDLGLDLLPPPPDTTGGPIGAVALPYLIQQIVNAAILGSIYGLTAVGYTLVYGVIGVINFAYGDIYMLGAFGAVAIFAMLGATPVTWLPLALLLALATSILYAAGHAWASERLVFRPLARQPTRALIAAIALSISLQEYVRLAQGARNHWLAPVWFGDWRLVERAGFTAHITVLQSLIIGLGIGLALVLGLIMSRTHFGRQMRAVAQDPRMAAMLGIDINRVIAGTFALGGALAGAAGFIDAVYYGGVGFYLGYIVGFKALTAALLGGIGSVAGALIGGLLIGGIETFWAAYLDDTYRDMAVFAVLVLVLTLRPSGLMAVDEPPIQRETAGRF
jgi:branched-chain amino acid transport system permease protein